ncbi:MAG TPA: enoyl-CoA hydratase [Acidimicrobiales bacterium]|nr:enoyl-CoA hydratase [Acidimicrobiales bacterium]
MSELVEVSVTDGVGTVTLNDPDRRNALTLDMVGSLCGALTRLEDDESVGAIVITGAAPAFCAGASLDQLGASRGTGLRAIYEGFLRVARSPVPTLAAVNGAAVGAGMNLALACDVRLAAKRAKFDTRFLQLGLHPGGGHTWLLERIVGPQAAAAMVLFGEVLDGEAAAAAGLVWRCVDDAALPAAAAELAARAASAPRGLSRRTKATLRAMPTVADHEAAVDLELDAQLWSLGQPEFRERLAALQERIKSR